jgi:prepilin-type N-terminal cleavage/methylation domain-containing protein/prepilin-type processing-associated H-X9-DG protein
MKSYNRSVKKYGFTLIELLVVIAILGLLATLLLPGIKRAVASAHSANCTSNLRQLFVGTVNYAQDHDGYVMYMGNPSERNYMHDFMPYVEVVVSNRASRTFVCPAHLDRTEANAYYSTYGLNTIISAYIAAGGRLHSTFGMIVRASTTPLFGDKQGSRHGTSLYAGDLTHPTRAPHIFRHGGGRMNVVFIDGHVQPFTFTEADSGAYPLTAYDTWRPIPITWNWNPPW